MRQAIWTRKKVQAPDGQTADAPAPAEDMPRPATSAAQQAFGRSGAVSDVAPAAGSETADGAPREKANTVPSPEAPTEPQTAAQSESESDPASRENPATSESGRTADGAAQPVPESAPEPAPPAGAAEQADGYSAPAPDVDPAAPAVLTPAEALRQLLLTYRHYYNVKTEDVEAPFTAEAEFHSHDEQYFLVKRAKLAEAESNEYVFFVVTDTLTPERIRALDACAWERGLSRVRPHDSHRNSDVGLVILADRIDPDAVDFITHNSHYKSYSLTLRGWSHYQLIALETSTGILTYNRQGKALTKLFRHIHL